ncbi:cation transporter [Aquiflexum lacus]|uniref:cation transporter n=1 Tax=Aquiflexum lacus TaxID=2483805 RepID=UPI00189519C7|nr:cation transporter [Aquiflexum lacus]
MNKSVFKISQMDCPSEENLLRLKLADQESIKNLEFDLNERKLTIYHEAGISEIQSLIGSLNLGDTLESSEESSITSFNSQVQQKKMLWAVLLINFSFFLIEITTGIISKSMGLVADSLDMLADAFVYAISLFAVGGSIFLKKKIARIAGYFQIILATIGLTEIIRRFVGTELMPDFSTMIIVSILALIANAFSLYLLQKAKSDEAHMQASMIFTSNDIVINIGVIIAGVLVNWLQSGYPDLVVGMIVFIIVIRGALRILKLGK